MIAAKGFGNKRKLQGGVSLLAGGAGLSAGMQQKFKKDPMTGRITDLKKKPKARVRRASKSISRVGGKGAMKQLKFANRKSVGALGGTSSEAQAFESAEAFTSAPTGAGGSIGAGAGVSDGAGGVSSSPNDGGPVSVGGAPQANSGAPGTGPSEDESPWTGMVMMSAALLTLASTMITIIGILTLLQEMFPIAYAIIEPYKQALFGASAGMAASATAMGLMIWGQYGQPEQGMILTTGGAITTGVAVASMLSQQPWTAWAQTIGGVAGIAAAVGSLLMMNKV